MTEETPRPPDGETPPVGQTIPLSSGNPRVEIVDSSPLTAPASAPPAPPQVPPQAASEPFIGPRSHGRRSLESMLVRVVATCGVIGIGVGVAAVLGTQNVHTWIIGLVVAALSVVLAAVLWSSRTL